MPPDEPNEEERLEELPEDNQTPFQPADPSRDDSLPLDSVGQPRQANDPTHPVTDTDVDVQEAYDAGLDAATGNEEPNAGNEVVDYQEPEDS